MVLGYKSVLRNLNRYNEEGLFSFNEVAHKMDMNPGQLKGMIDMFEHMGHIEKATETSASSCSGCGKCNCGNKKDSSSLVSAYILTEKGKRVCGLA